jgi:hypothetical protein
MRSSCAVEGGAIGGPACTGMGSVSFSRPRFVKTKRRSTSWHAKRDEHPRELSRRACRHFLSGFSVGIFVESAVVGRPDGARTDWVFPDKSDTWVTMYGHGWDGDKVRG